MKIDYNKEQLASEMRGSFLTFCQYFYPLLTDRAFIISSPPGRESHVITVCKSLTRAFRLEIPSQRLWISIPPGHGKSTLLVLWVAWTMAHYPDSKYLYISYSSSLAAKHTETIKRIIQLPHYEYLFGIKIRHDARGKEFFQTTHGGAVAAFGSTGSIVGTDAGLPGLNRFSGALLLDDLHKVDEAHSDTMRNAVINNYRETIQQRGRGILVPYIGIGQRVHEEDVAAFLLNGSDGYQWEHVVLPAIDKAGNPLYPEAFPLEMLRKKQEFDPYVFASQFQQNPIPAGGALFKPEWFVLLDEEPNMLATFITADTAETSKSYNDATVFSFFGVYEIESFGRKTGEYGLHWLDCMEIRIEPKDLKETFLDFWAECMRHPLPPKLIAIEKKSTGGTLLSLLDDIRAVQLRDIPRTRESGSKTKRFLEAQPYVAERRISFTNNARHVKLCIDHMSKITANETHRWDDICFIAGTKIATKFGYKNIEDINPNDKILTPFGYGKVICNGITGIHKVINKNGLTGTPNHPILIGDKFKQLDTLNDDDILVKLSFNGLLKWKYKKLLLSMELNIDSWGRDAIILANQKRMPERVLKDCMLRFGNFIAGNLFRKGTLFIIKTIIILIMTSVIWSVFQGANIFRGIKKIACDGITALREKLTLKSFKKKQNYGIVATQAGNGIVRMHEQVYFENGNIIAKFATIPLSESEMPFIVPKNAMTLNTLSELEKKEQCREVYNLTVEEYGVYFANNILVSNCDTLSDAVKFALIDKIIINASAGQTDYNQLAKNVTMSNNRITKLKKAAFSR